MRHAVWLRQDVRTTDNVALSQACERANDGVIALYVLTPETWHRHHWSAAKVDLLLRQLRGLSKDLAAVNIPLKILSVPTFHQVPAALADFCRAHQITQLFANQSYLLDEIQRDQQVEAVLQQYTICHWFHDGLLLPPQAVLKQDGTPFKVFTPYKRAFLQHLLPGDWVEHPAPTRQKRLSMTPDSVPRALPGFASSVDATLWPVGEQAIQRQLNQFCALKVAQYQSERDFPMAEQTSQLSPYLALGMVSIRQCVRALLSACSVEAVHQLESHPGAACWFNELIWREFYASIAWHFPQVVKGQAFQAHTEALPWSNNSVHFQTWCEGQTGFPLVDAGMRQLKQMGWMHNRLRMVTAMFLTKTLFIDWRWGEHYFMEQLIDGDFASNNGGWQWSASTGTDAAPYFRIFNPTTQSQRFDAQGDFIRRYCPELAACSNKTIHDPSANLRKACGYPEPIVDYKMMRVNVLAKFKALSK